MSDNAFVAAKTLRMEGFEFVPSPDDGTSYTQALRLVPQLTDTDFRQEVNRHISTMLHPPEENWKHQG